MDDALGELAHWSGESLVELSEWQRLGLLPDEPATSLAERLERVRLIRFAISRGYGPDRLAEITAAHGDMIGPFAAQLGPMVGEPVTTLERAAEQSGVDVGAFRSVLAAAGLADAPFVGKADIAAAQMIKTILDYGQPLDILLQLVRVFSDAANKIADASVRLFHLHVHEPLRADGAGGAELLQATNAIAAPFMALTEPAVVYLLDKAVQNAMREDMMLHLAEETTTPSAVPGELVRAVLFVDLSSFTPLAEIMGDTAATDVVARFSEIVRTAAATCSGQIVKQIGDEFMVVFPDGRAAVACASEMRNRAAAEPRFPALRIGAHVGSVLYREGDYFGTCVNVAARVAGAAGRNKFLVTDAVRRQLDLDIELVPVGIRILKGLSEGIELFEVVHDDVVAKASDPVCGMQLDGDAADEQLVWEGERVVFCSETCMRRFLERPERYTATTGPDR